MPPPPPSSPVPTPWSSWFSRYTPSIPHPGVFAPAVPTTWNALAPSLPMAGALFSFMSDLQCHLLREAVPDHRAENMLLSHTSLHSNQWFHYLLMLCVLDGFLIVTLPPVKCKLDGEGLFSFTALLLMPSTVPSTKELTYKYLLDQCTGRRGKRKRRKEEVRGRANISGRGKWGGGGEGKTTS